MSLHWCFEANVMAMVGIVFLLKIIIGDLSSSCLCRLSLVGFVFLPS